MVLDLIPSIQDAAINIIFNVIIGLALLVVGYGVAVIIEAVLKKAFDKAEVEKKLKEKKVAGALMGFTFSGIIIGLIKWIVFLWFLVSAVSIIETAFLFYRSGAAPVLTNFLVDFVKFLPVLLQGIIILVVGFMLAEFLATKVREGLKVQANAIAASVKIIVVYFTIVVALSNPAYGINIGIITTIFNYFVMAIAVALGGGLAIGLGLGMKDSVARIAKKNEHGFEKMITGKK